MLGGIIKENYYKLPKYSMTGDELDKFGYI